MDVTHQSITRDNWETGVALEVAPDQTSFLPNNAYWLAQAYAQREFVPLAMYADTMMVGFVMYADNIVARWWYLSLGSKKPTG